MLKKVLILHLFPFLAAMVLVGAVLYFLSESPKENKRLIEGVQERTRGVLPNLTEGNQAEIEFISSIKNKQQVTILGSSEFSNSPYCSYNFLADSLGIQAMGLGHAYHQNLSILCELLAADEYVDDSKICIVLSLGWFSTEGTNSSAFLEFVRPNFLTRIIQNNNIDPLYKQHIGKYISNHRSEINGVSKDMKTLENIFKKKTSKVNSLLSEYIENSFPNNTHNVLSYKTKLTYRKPKKGEGDYLLLSETLQKKFVSEITTNNIYVYDEYYLKHLLDEDGKQRKGSVPNISLTNNNELDDFYLLIKYLKSKTTKSSFIIQPLNPYYYAELEKYNELVETLTNVLDKNNIPYLNMHVATKEDYEPGALKDIMHLGDYGWMKINLFLDSLYNEN